MNDILLSPGIMLELYGKGAFPMADEITGEVEWYYPKIRAIIPLDKFNIPRSLKSFIRKTDFEVRFDYDTMTVVKKCGNRARTWISEKLIAAYQRIHEFGYLHSVEVYRNDKLIGGLYGVAIGGAFFGESMFSDVSNASKFALYHLIKHLNEKNFSLLDVQIQNEHLKMFGAIEIPLELFNILLQKALRTKTEF